MKYESNLRKKKHPKNKTKTGWIVTHQRIARSETPADRCGGKVTHAQSKGWDGGEKQRGETNPGRGTEVLSHYSLCLLSTCFSLSVWGLRDPSDLKVPPLDTRRPPDVCRCRRREDRERRRQTERRERDGGEEERQRVKTPRETISENPLTQMQQKNK